VKLHVDPFDHLAQLNFPSEIVPIFTKLGCNGGGCHGKAAGQNGFKLSLLGFDPREDYEHLKSESRGRRVAPANPSQSLLLTKTINAVPHGGGARTTPDTHEYRMLNRWITQGMPLGATDVPDVTSIQVFPKHRRMSPGTSQQLCVIATYADGSTLDVTTAVVFESNDPEMADVTPSGYVTTGTQIGDCAVMARYRGHVSVFRADIPTGRSPQTYLASANFIDDCVTKQLRSLGISESPMCDDATFIRRVTLDLTGRIPTLAELGEFHALPSETRRADWVQHLLVSPGYAEYFASKWNTILRNRRSRPEQHFATIAFHDWIRQAIEDNMPYDRFVREIVSASGSVASHPPVTWFQRVPDLNQRVEDAAQLFLGQRIQCARCHHHPYEKWSQGDYAELAAFFATVQPKSELDPVEPTLIVRRGKATAAHPKTGKALEPAGLDSETIQISSDADPRSALVDWMTSPENPFFARMLVNRYWKHFMGRGLVEPEDDMRVTNPPSNSELLNALAQNFIATRFDLRELVRTIVLSNTYSRMSDPIDNNDIDKRSYARFYPKRMTAEVLLDAVDAITLSQTKFAGLPAGTRAVALPDTAYPSYFLEVFGQPVSSTACECERSQDANLAQSLHLLNSEEMHGKLSADSGRAAQLASDGARPDSEKISELYRLALSRSPSDEQLKASLEYLGRKENRREAYEDLIWSLLNTKEFLFNH
jgi:hypothetical protein